VERARITHPPSNMTVQLGGTVSLTCTVGRSFRSQTRIDWFKDGMPLVYNTSEALKSVSNETLEQIRHSLSEDGTLHVHNVQATDAGQYTCIASNQAGFTSAMAYLNIAG